MASCLPCCRKAEKMGVGVSTFDGGVGGGQHFFIGVVVGTFDCDGGQ